MTYSKKLCAPFSSCVFARRAVPLPGQYFAPFSLGKQLLPLPNLLYSYYDQNREPCQNIDQAMYVVHSHLLPTPPGFIRMDPGVNAYGKPYVVPEYSNTEDEQIATYLTIQKLCRRPEEEAKNTVNELKQTGDQKRTIINTDLLGIPPASQQVTVPVEEQADTEIDAYQLQEGPDGYYLKPLKSGKALRATNYVLQLKEVRHYIGLNGKEQSDQRKIRFLVRLPELGKSIEMEVEYEKLRGITEHIRKKVGEGIIYRHQRIFAEQLDILLRSALSTCSNTYEYGVCGWMQLPNNKWFYVHDDICSPLGGIEFKSGFSFGRSNSSRDITEIVDAGFSMLSVSNDLSKSVVPFLWAHLGLLWSLFAQAGYPPHALLYISGVSGSLKTAVSKTMFNFTAIPEQDIPASFRDTSASMEVSIERYKDRVLLVDDYCPGANKTASRTMEQTLENLIRFYGDGNTKGRADPRMDKVYIKKAQGLCAITGEDIAGSLSSQLRCLFLTVDKGTFNGIVLKRFQDHPYLWTEYLATFVDILFATVPDVIPRIQSGFQSYRKQAEKVIRERRLVDTYCCLAVTARLVLETADGVTGKQYRDELLPQFEHILLSVCATSEQRAVQQQPARIFAETLMTLLQRQDVLIGNKGEFSEQPHSYLGFIDEDYWFLWPQETYRAVVKYYQSGGGNFPLSANALWTALAASNVLIRTKTTKQGGTYYENGTKISFAGRPRMLKIDPAMLKEVAEL